MWLPLGYIVKMALLVRARLWAPWGSNQRRKTIRPSVEAVPALVLFLCSPPAPVGAVPPLVLLLFSWPAPPLAEFPPPQAANNSTQSPMRRPITSHTRRDGFAISEWYMSLLLFSLILLHPG